MLPRLEIAGQVGYRQQSREDVMSWVTESPDAAEMDHILASHSLNPDALRAHLHLYRTIMFGPSGLSRAEREAVGVTVSAVNGCHY
jgi:alkylhydroperoxidase family enzyme